MGRGLSALQQSILKIGLEARQEGCGADRGWPDVYQLEVLVEHFGWPCPDSDWHARRRWADTRGRFIYPIWYSRPETYGKVPNHNDRQIVSRVEGRPAPL